MICCDRVRAEDTKRKQNTNATSLVSDIYTLCVLLCYCMCFLALSPRLDCSTLMQKGKEREGENKNRGTICTLNVCMYATYFPCFLHVSFCVPNFFFSFRSQSQCLKNLIIIIAHLLIDVMFVTVEANFKQYSYTSCVHFC